MKCFSFSCANWNCSMKMKRIFDCKNPLPHQCSSPVHRVRGGLGGTLLAAISDSKSVKKEESFCLNLESKNKCKNKAVDHPDFEMIINKKLREKENEDDDEPKRKNIEVEVQKQEAEDNEEDLISEKNSAGPYDAVSRDHHLVIEESSESLFSLSINSKRQFDSAVEIGEGEVSSRPSKLNPDYHNHEQEKENKSINIELGEIDDQICKPSKENETAVDATSLSNWLVGSPQKKSISPESEKSYGVRRRCVLGEITHDQDRKMQGDESCVGDDQRRRIGTVGNYWRRVGREGLI